MLLVAIVMAISGIALIVWMCFANNMADAFARLLLSLGSTSGAYVIARWAQAREKHREITKNGRRW